MPLLNRPTNLVFLRFESVYILGIKECAIKSNELRTNKKNTREMLNISAHYKKCPRNSIPMLLDDTCGPKYYVPDEIVEVLEIWEEFLQNTKG